MLNKLTCLKTFFYVTYFTERHLFTFHFKNIYNFSISQDNFAALQIEVSVFTNSLCIFIILSIIVLNFSKFKVQKNLLQ